MSEEILKALMELFALVVRQDGGFLDKEREYVAGFLEKQLSSNLMIKYLLMFDEYIGPSDPGEEIPGNDFPTVQDSVKILNICRQINRTLNKGQKTIVLIRLYELINSSRKFSPRRQKVISIVVEVFKTLPDEIKSIEEFVLSPEPELVSDPHILVLRPGTTVCELCNKMHEGYSNTTILFLRIPSVDLYFIRYFANEQLLLNGVPVGSQAIHSFPKGSSLRLLNRQAFYYSDVSSKFLSETITQKISFNVSKVSFRPDNRHRTLVNVSLSAEQGNLVGIMGASGSGKTTLLNLMSGILEPSSGSVTMNGLDIVKDKEKLEGVMGLVPQDDLLIEELTVFENLYYAACQCFGGMSENLIISAVEKTLGLLGLSDKRDLKVGSPLNKVISGGQRKRLNIALELIREPSVLFLDEPTSGLSSKDSENIMDLLRELTLKGKLIFTVIHQPSSDIFKMFDKVAILDQGGYLVYFGNPVESVIHFKTLDYQINASQGECPSCGSVNPETIFKIIESQVVDEFGNYTEKRKVKPKQWADRFKILNTADPEREVTEAPVKNLAKPGLLRQYFLYMARDLKSKVSNIQYVTLTLLEAPVLAFMLAFIIRYIPDPDSDAYHFSGNENIPVYIFMSIIVAVFLGLTISAEEIFRDRNILRRERFLNLSRNSYLLSKVTILMGISAIQSLLFVVVANPILGIKGMSMTYWLALFASAFTANMIGLIISASFNSVITIYIVIPLLLIPMMVLSGAMFSFDKLNRTITRPDKVPLIAEFMPTRWTYEALMVSQFKDNRYSSLVYTAGGDTYYSLQKKISQADFNTVHRLPQLAAILDGLKEEYEKPEKKNSTENDLALIRNELGKIAATTGAGAFSQINALYPGLFNKAVAGSLSEYLSELTLFFNNQVNEAERIKDDFVNLNKDKLKILEKNYYNYKLEEIVTRYYDPDKIITFKNSLIQNTDPVYLDPAGRGLLNFRTHFFAPLKNLSGKPIDTYAFNISVLFISSLLLYLILYFDLLSVTVKKIARYRTRKTD